MPGARFQGSMEGNEGMKETFERVHVAAPQTPERPGRVADFNPQTSQTLERMQLLDPGQSTALAGGVHFSTP